MAGLPCDECQEDSFVLPNGEVGFDGQDRMIYRRFRTCLNTNCPKYLIRRETIELFIPTKTERKVNPSEVRPGLKENSDDSQPSLFET